VAVDVVAEVAVEPVVEVAVELEVEVAVELEVEAARCVWENAGIDCPHNKAKTANSE
jgi:hypothetical protein